MKKRLIILALLLAACSPTGTTVETTDTPNRWVQISGSNFYSEFITEQGIPCIVVDGYQSVAVTCDWSNR